MPQQQGKPAGSEQYPPQNFHKSDSSSRLARHSISGLPSSGQQRSFFNSSDPATCRGLLCGRSRSSRAFNFTAPAEEPGVAEQALQRAALLRGGLIPTSARGVVISPSGLLGPSSDSGALATSPFSSGSGTSAGTAAAAAGRQPPFSAPGHGSRWTSQTAPGFLLASADGMPDDAPAGGPAPRQLAASTQDALLSAFAGLGPASNDTAAAATVDAASVASATEAVPIPTPPEAPPSVRRPSLLRSASSNSTASLSSPSALPKILSPAAASPAASPSGVGAVPAVVAAADVAATAVVSPQGPNTSSHLLFPAPPASPRTSQSSLATRRARPPPPSVHTNSTGTFLTAGAAGISPTMAVTAPAANAAGGSVMVRRSLSLRARLPNIREDTPPAPAPGSRTALSGESAYVATATDTDELDAGGAPLHRPHPNARAAPSPLNQGKGQHHALLLHSLEEEDLVRHSSVDMDSSRAPSCASFPMSPASFSPLLLSDEGRGYLDDPAGASPTEATEATGTTGATSGVAVMLRGSSFRRAAVFRSISLDTFRGAAAGDRGDGGSNAGGKISPSSFAPFSPAGGSSAAAMAVGRKDAVARTFPGASAWGLENAAQLAETAGVGGGARLGGGDAYDGGGESPDERAVTIKPAFAAAIASMGRISDVVLGHDPAAATTTSTQRGYSISGSGVRNGQQQPACEDMRPASRRKAALSLPGCLSRMRLFNTVEALPEHEESDEEEEESDEGGEELINSNGDDAPGGADAAKGEKAMRLQEFAPLDEILDPLLDVLDPNRAVARRCLQRLHRGDQGGRQRAVESWAGFEAVRRNSDSTILNRSDSAGTGTRSVSGTVTVAGVGSASGASAAEAVAVAAPSLASLAGQVLKLPCVGVEKLADPEKRQKVVQRLREAADVRPAAFAQTLTIAKPGGDRWHV